VLGPAGGKLRPYDLRYRRLSNRQTGEMPHLLMDNS
jgi:hypothetical protein